MAISDKNTRIQITMPKELKKQLQEKAKFENRSISNYVVTLIQREIEGGAYGKQNPQKLG